MRLAARRPSCSRTIPRVLRSVLLGRRAALLLIFRGHDDRYAPLGLALAAFDISAPRIEMSCQLTAGHDIVAIGQDNLLPLENHHLIFSIITTGIAGCDLRTGLEINFSRDVDMIDTR